MLELLFRDFTESLSFGLFSTAEWNQGEGYVTFDKGRVSECEGLSRQISTAAEWKRI